MRRGPLFLLLALGGAWLAVASATSLTVNPVNASAFRVCALSGYPGTSAAVLDTYSNQDSRTTNYGSAASLVVANRNGKAKVGYLRYDLSRCQPAIPTTAVIKQATLRLFITAQAGTNRTYGAYRVDGSSCPESLPTCWGETSLTYNNRPASVSTATSTATVNTGTANNNKFYSWNVTADVVRFVAGTAANYGWAIADPASYSGTAEAGFASVEAANAAQAPRLVIVYSP